MKTKSLLVVSHFTKNKGTTDYFLEHLRKNKIKYYYLRHPFNFTDLQYSELIYFDGTKEEVLNKYKRSKNAILDLFRNFRVSKRISKELKNEVDIAIGFGSFNAVPLISSMKKSNNKVYFWGVDYSRKRFGNPILNKIYHNMETKSCKNSDLVIQPSKRQEEARIKFHQLNKDRSIIIPNGVEEINFNKDFSKYKPISLIYIGSISPQHGIIDFVKYFYLNKKIDYKLFIIGGGESEKELINLIKDNNLYDKIIYLGTKDKKQILNFIKNSRENIFGLATYNLKAGDDVYYRDSLKIKEYINYKIPFITSNIMFIPEDLVKFGFIYKDFEELELILKNKIKQFDFNVLNNSKAINKYYWENLLQEIP